MLPYTFFKKLALAKGVSFEHFSAIQAKWLLKNSLNNKTDHEKQEKSLREAQELLIRHGFSVEKNSFFGAINTRNYCANLLHTPPKSINYFILLFLFFIL